MSNRTDRALALAAGLCVTIVAHGTTTPALPGAPGTEQVSLVVVDKNCSTVVEPFKITENLGTLIKDTVGGLLGGLKDRIANRGAKPDPKQISEEARLRAKRMNWLPMNVEVMYGQRLHDQETLILERDKPDGKKYYPVAEKILEDVKKGIGTAHEYDFRLFILKQPGRNALARPGGFLYLDAGLLKDPKQLDKAYFAVAHEVSHVLKRHETRELQGLIIDSFETTEDLKLIANASNNAEAILAKVKINKDQYTRHHMDQELQADACAARVLRESYQSDPKLAATISSFLKELTPPTREELEAETNALAAKADVAAKTAEIEAAQAQGGKKAKKKEKEEKVEDALDASALAYDVVTSPARRHPNSKERTENLTSMYAQLTSKQPEKPALAESGQKPVKK